MFFKKKKKLDARVRFQQHSFLRQVQDARAYRRTAPPLPAKNNRWWTKFWVLALASGLGVLGVAYYILFVPNILFVQTVTVAGVEGEALEGIKKTAQEYIETKTYAILPRQNKLLLNTQELTQYILQQHEHVLGVSEVRQAWFSRELAITIVPRVEQFLLEYGFRKFVVSSDGVVVKEIFEAVPNGNYLRLTTLAQNTPRLQETVLSAQALLALNTLRAEFFSATGVGIDYVELLGLLDKQVSGSYLSVQELVVHTYPHSERKLPGFKILFDVNSDPGEALANVGLLLSNSPKDRLGQLAYIDMRFKNRGFICLANTACTHPPEPPPPAETVEETSEE